MTDLAIQLPEASRRLDAIDRKILTVLQEDASLSVAEIGQQPADQRFRGELFRQPLVARRVPRGFVRGDFLCLAAEPLFFLDYLAVRLEGLRVLAVTATRAGDATLTIGPIARLAEHPDVHALPLAPLAYRFFGASRWDQDRKRQARRAAYVYCAIAAAFIVCWFTVAPPKQSLLANGPLNHVLRAG